MSNQRMFYLSGCDINYKETDADGNVAVTGFVATIQAGDHDFTPPTKAFELGLALITKANTHSDTLAALKALVKSAEDAYIALPMAKHNAELIKRIDADIRSGKAAIAKAEAQ